MEEASNPGAAYPLEEMYVVSEAATLLGVKTNRIHAMIDDQSLNPRRDRPAHRHWPYQRRPW